MNFVCQCDFCLSMRQADKDWDTFIPKTNLQKRMKKVVKKIEKKNKKKYLGYK